MLEELNIYTALFIVNLSFFTATIIIAWVSFRSYWANRRIQGVVFGTGLLLLAALNLLKNIFSTNILLSYTPALLIISLALLELSFIRKKWHYFLVILAVAALFVPSTIYWLPLIPILLSPILYLGSRYGCQNICNEEVCKHNTNNTKERVMWVIVFAICILLPVLNILTISTAYAGYLNVTMAVAFVLTSILTGLIFYHIFHCVSFAREEKAILSMVTGFIIVTITLSFLNGNLLNTFLENETKTFEKEEIKLVKVYLEKEYPGGVLPTKIAAKDISLNDFSDELYAKTGIKITFFYGAERVAGAVSDSGTRMIGSQLDSAIISDKVLGSGELYSANIQKGEKLYVATYIPVYGGEKIIGMVGLGKPLSNIYDLTDRIFYRTIAGLSIVMVIVYGVIFSISPALRKRKNKA